MDVTNPVDLEDAAQVYKASQHQRALERNVRAAGRAAHAAITPQAKTRARRDLAAARAASAAHRQQHHLRMMKVSAQRRERPYGAR
jgi:predicted DsbA family dithiol-disulfide isomerase